MNAILMKVAIKPCPFCGHTDIMITHTSYRVVDDIMEDSGKVYNIFCKKCLGGFRDHSFSSEAEAVEAWNSWKKPAEIVKEKAGKTSKSNWRVYE